MSDSYTREQVSDISAKMSKTLDLIHVVVGPRQVGKTTAAHQIADQWKGEVIYGAADQMLPPSPEWIETKWLEARQSKTKFPLLVLDEIQKIKNWSEVVKSLWDQDRRTKSGPAVLLLGSSSLLLQSGLTESLAGRFVLHRFMHWGFKECRDAFGWELEEWLCFGGYPGAAKLVADESFWRTYVTDSLIEPAIAKDVLQLQVVIKPALLRNLFACAAQYPAQIYSYNKILGQLHDAGNTTTLAHYLKLLESAFLISGLEQFKGGEKRRRASSPKLILWNNALVNALSGRSRSETTKNSAWWGRVVENAVGAHLLNSLPDTRYYVSYWRKDAKEVDFIIQYGSKLIALEVKSGRPQKPAGLNKFLELYPKATGLILGSGGYPLEKFFERHPQELFT